MRSFAGDSAAVGGLYDRRLSLWLAFGLTALVMIYLSYSLPRLLPGDFVTAMYSSSR